MQSYPSASMPRKARLVLAALLLGVVGYGATTLPGSATSTSSALGHWLYPSLMLGAAAMVVTRAWSRREERWAWSLIAAGMLIPAVRNFLYPAFGALNELRPLWLCFYPLLFAGLLLL